MLRQFCHPPLEVCSWVNPTLMMMMMMMMMMMIDDDDDDDDDDYSYYSITISIYLFSLF